MSDNFSNERNGEEESFADLLDSYSAGMSENIRVGDRVRGEIIFIGSDAVFVDTGSKTDGVVEKAELLNENGELPYKKGDILDLYVVSLKGNEVRLSRALSGIGGLRVLEEAHEKEIPVEGKVKTQVKGGFQVEVMQRRAFCPLSQIDLRVQEDPAVYIGETYPFLIIQFEEEGRNIILSRRELLRREQEKGAKSFCEGLKVGAELQGRVTKLMPYGAFVELFPGVEGMVHVSEISWSRTNAPAEVLGVGDQVAIKVIDMAQGTGPIPSRISLSIKQTEGDPWEKVRERVHEGEKLRGKVTRCANFGAFVELMPGVEGLVHISEMSYRKRVLRPEEMVKPGDTVDVMVKEVDYGKRRISLSMKDAEGDPWIEVGDRFRIGQTIQGEVEKSEHFGIFVVLEPGVTGLLPVSKIKSSPSAGAIEKLRPGDRVSVIIEEIHPAERKITLAPGDSREEEDWRRFMKKKERPAGLLGEKLREALGAKKEDL